MDINKIGFVWVSEGNHKQERKKISGLKRDQDDEKLSLINKRYSLT